MIILLGKHIFFVIQIDDWKI